MTKKKLRYLLAILIPGIFFTISSCSSGSEKKTKKPETTVQKETSPPVTTVNPNEMASEMARGEQIYKEKCIICHQANGQGLPNAFPSLAGSRFLLDNKVLAVAQVLNGSANVQADRTVKYPAPMPPQVSNKEDAVAVINYVLNNFGNNGGHVTMDDVKDVVILPLK
jgi:mono/diheme cytochrome c family protein